MSGVKYRTISDTEYRSLTNRANQGTIEAQRRAAAERANRQLTKDLEAARSYNSSLAGRIDNLDKKLTAANTTATNLRKELNQTVANSNKALKEQATNFEKKLATTRKDFADAMDKNNRRIEQVISDNNKAIRSEIDTLRSDTKKDLDALNTKVTDLSKKVGDPAKVVDMARDYLAVAQELLDDAKNFRHEMFLPGQSDNVAAAIKKAESSIALGTANPAAASAALVNGQDAFDAAKKFHDDLLAAETEWAAKLSATLEALTAAEAQIQANAKVDFAGEEMDVDHWSNGGLKKLQDLANNLRKQLEDKDSASKLSIADLDAIASGAQLIADDSDQVLTGAFFALECSDDRAGLAADLVDELAGKAGLEIVKQEGYEGGDQRAANMVHLKNGTTGFEVVITLIPVMVDGKCGYEARTEIVNEGTNAAIKNSFDKALKEVMKDYDLIGNCPIPVNPKREDELKNWEKRKTTTVATVPVNTTNPLATPATKAAK